jgi:hypothetical protein
MLQVNEFSSILVLLTEAGTNKRTDRSGLIASTCENAHNNRSGTHTGRRRRFGLGLSMQAALNSSTKHAVLGVNTMNRRAFLADKP